MKAGTILASVVGSAVLAGSGGFYGGLKFAEHTLTEGARYVYGAKEMPLKTASVPFDKDAPPRIDPWRSAHGQARAYCQIAEKASAGEAIPECSPYKIAIAR